MPNSTNTPRFIPLNSTSQSGADCILYFDSHVSTEALYEATSARLQAVYNVLECLFEFNNPPASALSAIAVVSSLLLSDAMSLLPHLIPKTNT